MVKDFNEKITLPDLEKQEAVYQDYEYPKVSIVIPTLDCSEKIPMTIDSLLSQKYPNFEIIIVDASSKDRTAQVVKNYRDERIFLFSVSGGYERYEMMNKGITHATGDYINFLFPGDFYIHPGVLTHIMNQALSQKLPQLVYCGTIIRDGKHDPKILFRLLNLKLLRRGQQPTSLQSCWFTKDTFKLLGKFNIHYRMRGGYDFLCRFCLNSSLKSVSTTHVLTDYDLRLVTRKMVLEHFFETLNTLYRYFGLFYTIRWLFIQKDLSRYFKLWWKSVQVAFVGR